VRWPTHLELPVKRHRPEAVVLVMAGEGSLETHVAELPDRAGVSPSPQVFSRGKCFFSTQRTSTPMVASQ